MFNKVHSRDELISALEAYRLAVDKSLISSITNEKGEIVYVNHEFCRVSQYTSDELVGNTHGVINSKHHPKAFFVDMWKTILSGNVWHGEVRNKAKDGSYYWVDSTIVPVRGEGGKIRWFLSLRTLITDRKEKEIQDLKRRYEHLENMMFIMSHKFRRHIANILTILQFLDLDELKYKLEELPDVGPEVTRWIDHIAENSNELDNLTKEFSSYLHSIKDEVGK